MLEIFSSDPVAKGRELREEAALPCVTVSQEESNPAGWRKALPACLDVGRESKAQWHVSWWSSPWSLFSDLLLPLQQSKEFTGMSSSCPFSFLFLVQEEGLCVFPLRTEIMAFSPCFRLVLREDGPFSAKPSYFHRCIAQEREVWLYWFHGCLVFLSLNILIIGINKGGL